VRGTERGSTTTLSTTTADKELERSSRTSSGELDDQDTSVVAASAAIEAVRQQQEHGVGRVHDDERTVAELAGCEEGLEGRIDGAHAGAEVGDDAVVRGLLNDLGDGCFFSGHGGEVEGVHDSDGNERCDSCREDLLQGNSLDRSTGVGRPL
jgi:hypothetical protein